MDLQLISHFVESLGVNLSPSRMLESIVLLIIIWRKVRPHLTKIEDRIAGLESAVRDGFKSGEVRFENIETRLIKLEAYRQGSLNVRG